MSLCWLPDKAFASEIQIMSASTRLIDTGYVVDTELSCNFGKETLEALNSGVPITIIIDVEIMRERDLLWDTKVATSSQGFRLEHHVLTDLYLLINLTTSASRSFHSLPEAIVALENIPPLPLTGQHVIDPELRYTANIRARLDINALPALMRPLAYLSPDWWMSSNWYRWQFQP